MNQPARRSATYEDLRDLPEYLIGEILNGELHTQPRPAPRHALAASVIGDDWSALFIVAGADQAAGGFCSSRNCTSVPISWGRISPAGGRGACPACRRRPGSIWRRTGFAKCSHPVRSGSTGLSSCRYMPRGACAGFGWSIRICGRWRSSNYGKTIGCWAAPGNETIPFRPRPSPTMGSALVTCGPISASRVSEDSIVVWQRIGHTVIGRILAVKPVIRYLDQESLPFVTHHRCLQPMQHAIGDLDA